MADWHSITQRSHHLASGLARLGHPCVYLNPHLGRQYRKLHFSDPGPRMAGVAPGVTELHLRLPSEPVFHHRLPTGAEVEALARPFGALDGKPMWQVVSIPTWLPLALLLRERHGWPILYDCHDLLSGFEHVAPEIKALEADLFRQSDRVVVSSEMLREEFSRACPGRDGDCAVIRNACARFDLDERVQEVTQRRPVNPPTAGYVGSLNHWLDVAGLRSAALECPEIRFRLFGPRGRVDLEPLDGLENVLVGGEVDYGDVDGHLALFRLAMIPFTITGLTAATNPIKIYEYFSHGLPVVTSRLPELVPFDRLVYPYEGADELASQVRAAAAENDPDRRVQRVLIAHENTWDDRIRRFASFVAQPAGSGMLTGAGTDPRS